MSISTVSMAPPMYGKASYLILLGLFETVTITKKRGFSPYDWYNTEWLESYRVLLHNSLEELNWNVHWSG